MTADEVLTADEIYHPTLADVVAEGRLTEVDEISSALRKLF